LRWVKRDGSPEAGKPLCTFGASVSSVSDQGPHGDERTIIREYAPVSCIPKRSKKICNSAHRRRVFVVGISAVSALDPRKTDARTRTNFSP
jgi:hypothetical protein